MDRAIPRWVAVWRLTAVVLVMLIAGAALIAFMALLAQFAFDIHSSSSNGPAVLGSVMLAPFCIGLLYLEWRALAQRDGQTARFLGGAGLLVGGGLLLSLGLGALGLVGIGRPNSEYANWADVVRTGGIAAFALFLGGGHWVWAGFVSSRSHASRDSTAEPVEQ